MSEPTGFCGACGKTNSYEDDFCVKCGKRLAWADGDAPPEEPPTEPEPEIIKPQSTTPAPVNFTPPLPQHEWDKITGNKPQSHFRQQWSMLPILAKALVIFVVAFFGLMIMGAIIGSPDTPAQAPQPAITPSAIQLKAAAANAAQIEAKKQADEARQAAKDKQELLQAQQQRTKNIKLAQRLLAGLSTTKDKVEDVTFYQSPTSPKFVNSRSDMWLYFVKNASAISPLHLKISYVADSWLFIKSYTIKADGQMFTVTPKYDEVKSDYGDGIWEWYDEEITDNELNMVNAVADSQNAVIRCQGDKYADDRTISDEEKQALKQVLAAYDAEEQVGM